MGPPRLAPYERGHALHRDEHPGFYRIGADAHLTPSISEANIHRCTLAQTRLVVKRLTVVRMGMPRIRSHGFGFAFWTSRCQYVHCSKSCLTNRKTHHLLIHQEDSPCNMVLCFPR
jgi:hypothetical protein